ncbi:MAG: NADH-quinone oxidoreductase subunit A [SAR202 cluster bacterium]|jgi:NADH-quinone oxidoreductase subunit A|nr:NADH-quinone oxidoreductase subunit A [SAR202 cluster bacterium]|tara:strand:- start:15146 stop:15529 length:384 start_codon:yes stop_codon:yes gene_type:complete
MLEDYFRQYGLIAIFTALAVILPGTLLVLSWLLSFVRVRPHKPSFVKSSPYESGMNLVGKRWPQFNFRYYQFALLFVVFDVETIFIYPWAVSFGKLGLFAFVEMLIFIMILVVGWAYAWRYKALEWS